MSFGIQIINDRGSDIVAGSANVFAIDNIYNPMSSGSKSYTLSAGETLTAIPLILDGGGGRYLTGVTYSGNTVSWSVDTGCPTTHSVTIVVYKQGVV